MNLLVLGGTSFLGYHTVTEAIEAVKGITEEERPLWFPEDQIPFDAVDSSKALAAGLSFRPVEDTARDTLEWMRSRLRYQDLKAGFSPEFEHGLPQHWREQHP